MWRLARQETRGEEQARFEEDVCGGCREKKGTMIREGGKMKGDATEANAPTDTVASDTDGEGLKAGKGRDESALVTSS